MYNSNEHPFSSSSTSSYSPYVQQRKLSYSITTTHIKEEPEEEHHVDERRHSIQFPSSPPPETTNKTPLKIGFSSPSSSTSWTELQPLDTQSKSSFLSSI